MLIALLSTAEAGEFSSLLKGRQNNKMHTVLSVLHFRSLVADNSIDIRDLR